MNKFMILVCVGFVSTAAIAEPAGDGKVFHPAFERLKTLAGTWKIEGRNDEVRYFLTANGTAVVEVFDNMSSVYHMDGDALKVTHYCGAKNQPRMTAVVYDLETATLAFDFVDVTNVSDPEEYFTRQVEIVFRSEDHVEVHFNGLEAGKEFPVALSLVRK